MNLFESTKTSTDPKSQQTEKIMSKIFIITFITCFVTLLAYTSTATHAKTFTVLTPSLQEFNHLYRQYSQSLSCACTEISTAHQVFIQISYSLHEVCSSFYTTDQWIIYLRQMGLMFIVTDFRAFGTQLFQALRSLCLLAEESIQISLKQFYSDSHIAAFVIPENFLRSQSETIIQQFITSTTNTFLLSLRLVSNTTQANALFSALFTNYYLKVSLANLYVNSEGLVYDDRCSCSYSSQCTTRAIIFLNDSYESVWHVPGMYRGCYLLEGLRRSHLGCFYNQTCLDELVFQLGYQQSITLQPMNSSQLTRFDVTTSIGTIMDSLMVERWNWTVNHDKYYEACSPIECTYTVTIRNDLLNIVTTLIGLVGGLFTGLKLINRIIIRIIEQILKQKVKVHVQSDAPVSISSKRNEN